MLQELDSKERAALVKELSREELEKKLAEISTVEYLAIGHREVKALGTYTLRLTKEEKIDGKWIGPQTMIVDVRESPIAIRGEVSAGPSKGRRFLYNEKVKAKQLRAREAGLLSVAGAVWLDLDSSLARRDTKHPITDLRYGALMEIIENDFKRASTVGGHTRKNVGLEKDGAYCMKFTAPAAAKNLYARETLLCFDPVTGLVTRLEVSDEKGPFERFRYELVKKQTGRGDDHFTTDAAGL